MSSTTTSVTEAETKDPLISLPQVFGSALAAACATAAASYFGIAGTIIGAVTASVVATVVSTTSAHSMRQAPRLAVASAGVLAIVALAVTGLEGATGRSLSTLMGHEDATAGTTISRAVSGDRAGRATVRTEVVKQREQAVVTPTGGPAPEQPNSSTTEPETGQPTPVTPTPTSPDGAAQPGDPEPTEPTPGTTTPADGDSGKASTPSS